jgi:putative membrane protein
VKLLMRWLISAVAIAAAAWLVPGNLIQGDRLVVILAMAIVLGLINAFVRPILTFFSIPLVLVTFGLFLLVINAAAFWIASRLSGPALGLVGIDGAFQVSSFVTALLDSLVVSIVGAVLNAFVKDDKD